MKVALLLIAMGFGFKIFAEASTNAKKSIKNLGRLVGAFIMIVALVGTVCKIGWIIKCSNYGKSGSFCPIHEKQGLVGHPDITSLKR